MKFKIEWMDVPIKNRRICLGLKVTEFEGSLKQYKTLTAAFERVNKKLMRDLEDYEKLEDKRLKKKHKIVEKKTWLERVLTGDF